uniref:Uncharacterized protein n=1 Tax=Anguilla anguilla TaxID=7936 RepID=A0A0E9W1P8_ANGAN
MARVELTGPSVSSSTISLNSTNKLEKMAFSFAA